MLLMRESLDSVARRLTLDVPLPAALEAEYTSAAVRRYRLPERIADVGVEDLALEAAFTDPQRPGVETALLDVAAVDDGWIRRVSVAGAVPVAIRLGRFARRVSVSDTVVAGALPREVAFQLSGQLLLVERARADGDQLRAVMTTAATAGPNAVVDLVAVGEDQEVETQRRWAVGLLLDGVHLTDSAGRPAGVIWIANQGNRGTGHGWSGANQRPLDRRRQPSHRRELGDRGLGRGAVRHGQLLGHRQAHPAPQPLSGPARRTPGPVTLC